MASACVLWKAGPLSADLEYTTRDTADDTAEMQDCYWELGGRHKYGAASLGVRTDASPLRVAVE
ncbi:MAG: hypothetical protein HY332_17115 [Chloroflexi bacterium]|nr:hypothetical protein [Chloroflexota bacterium]